MQSELENLQHAHNDKAKKLLDLKKEISKINLYKDTIRKQEKVIAKLESLLEKTLKDTQKAREGMIELEQLRTENMELQKMAKQANTNDRAHSDIQRYRDEIAMLENLVQELRDELKNKRPQTAGDADWEDEKIELEVKLQKAQARVDAMQQEMDQSAAEFAREISRLKIIISEKESIINTMNGAF